MKTIVGITDKLAVHELSSLDNFVSLYNKVSHKLYVDLFIKKLPVKDLCPLYQDKYSINKRQFSYIQKCLEGKVSSILSLNKNYILDAKDKIKAIEKDLIKQNKTFNSYKTKYKKDGKLSLIETNLKKKLNTKIKYNYSRLDRLKIKLNKLELIKETGNAHLCFGSNKLFKQQFQINSANNLTQFKNHEQWYEEYNYQRNKEFTLIGSKDESAGNVNAQISYIKDNLFTLKLNINPKAKKTIDKYINLKITVNHEMNTLVNIINNNNSKNKELWQALTYKLIKQPSSSHNKNNYIVNISFEKHLVKHIVTSKSKGCIGVDINQDHLAVSDLDSKGNLLAIHTYNYDLNGSKHQNINSISLAVKELMKLSVKLNKPIVIEQLDFSAKKKNLSQSNDKSNYSKQRNRQLSNFAYSKLIELIRARAEDNYVEVREVNPAFTSIIGGIKYSSRSGIGVHHGAAICIGRKGLFNQRSTIKVVDKETNKEYTKVVTKEYKERRISSRNRQIKSINLPVRNNLNSVVYWKELQKNMVKSEQHEKCSSSDVANRSTSLGISKRPAMNASFGTES